MGSFLNFSIIGEGSTDYRFLRPVIERALIEVCVECKGVIDIQHSDINFSKIGLTFCETLENAIELAKDKYGVNLLFVHADADAKNYESVIETEFERCLGGRNTSVDDFLVPVIPIQEVEAWMLANKELLKDEIGTTLSDNELGLTRNPESIADPKGIIKEAIRIAFSKETKRRRKNLQIADLYETIGNKIELSDLEQLSSYKHFYSELEKVLRNKNLLM